LLCSFVAVTYFKTKLSVPNECLSVSLCVFIYIIYLRPIITNRLCLCVISFWVSETGNGSAVITPAVLREIVWMSIMCNNRQHKLKNATYIKLCTGMYSIKSVGVYIIHVSIRFVKIQYFEFDIDSVWRWMQKYGGGKW